MTSEQAMGATTPQPSIGRGVYLATTAYVAGDVTLGDDCTVMHQAVIRGDVSAIRIGARVNVQDAAVIHTEYEVPLDIGDDVVIGHRAVVHCRRVGRNTLIGIGAILLDGAQVGDGCVVAAGAVVPPEMTIPRGKLVMGVPARVVRDTTETERKYVAEVIEHYAELGRKHQAGMYPNICHR